MKTKKSATSSVSHMHTIYNTKDKPINMESSFSVQHSCEPHGKRQVTWVIILPYNM